MIRASPKWSAFLLAFALSARGLAMEGPSPVTTKAGGGQPALLVGFDASGKLRAAVCGRPQCELDSGSVIDVPAEAAAREPGATLRVIPVGKDRSAVLVDIPDPDAGRNFTAIVLAPLSGTTPLVPFSGYTGFFEGLEGEQHGMAVLVRPEAIYVGKAQQGADLCGRPALLSPSALDPKTLTLKPAKLQRLEEAERASAPSITASAGQPEALPAILRAAWASSAADSEPPEALTDGKLETRWAEDRGGVGRGEFAVLLAPREVPIEGFSVVVRRPADATAKTAVPEDPDEATPREFWIATDHELFKVILPDAAAKTPGAVWQVTLPHPVQTECVGVVLESSRNNTADARVGIAEIQARAVLHGTLEELVKKLSAGSPEAASAAALLRASGPDGARAVAENYAALDDTGKRLAFDVLDEAACDVALPAYIDALIGNDEGRRRHAVSALPKCGAVAAEGLALALPNASPEARPLLADELSELSPETAVRALVPLLDTASTAERRTFRSAIGRAATRPAARNAVVAALAQTDLGPIAAIDLLRALGSQLSSFGDPAIFAFERVRGADASFRTRFLLLRPAAELSAVDPAAQGFFLQALTRDENPRVRAEAIRVLPSQKAYAKELSTLVTDPDVRVRQAAVTALGTGDVEQATDAIVHALSNDAWPLVRRATARALSTFAPNPAVDRALGEAASDPAADVRGAALASLGLRRAQSQASVVRERLEDDEEVEPVRAAAAFSLGAMCDAEAADILTHYARLLVDPQATDAGRSLAESAVAALAMLKPRDLAARLSPLLAKTASPAVVRFAGAAVASRGRCAAASKGR